MPSWYLPAVAVVLVVLAAGLWLREVRLRLADARPGRHRPDTVIPVGPLYRITYPNLFDRHRREDAATQA